VKKFFLREKFFQGRKKINYGTFEWGKKLTMDFLNGKNFWLREKKFSHSKSSW
jgi:hypothetical protein